MSETIRIQMMDEFVIYLNERQADHMVNKSKKGLALIEYLIANRGEPVSNRRLLSTFWNDENVTNPENALKTLISRVRTLLSQISPELGNCIVADRGAYHWECPPEMTVDLYELEDIFARLPNERDGERKREAYRRMMTLYRGALLQKSELNEWAYPRAMTLHNQYIAGVYDYIDLLKQSGRDEDEREIISVCRSALEREPFDDSIHIELMRTLLRGNNATEAKAQYEEVMHLHYHYLNVKPSRELMEFYNEIVEASKNIEFNLESICRQLYQSSREQSAFVCDFAVFREIFNLQIRNIERLGTTMFLAVITVSGTDGGQMESIRQEREQELTQQMHTQGEMKKEEVEVTLMVSECGEFHNLGEFYENIHTVEEAIAIWKQIPPERMHGIPAIGINVHRTGEESYMDDEVDLLSGNRIDLEILEHIPSITSEPKAMEVIAELVAKLPEMEIDGVMSEDMEAMVWEKRMPDLEPAEQLAVEIDRFSYDYDIYSYRNNNLNMTESVSEISEMIVQGNTEPITDWLNEVISEGALPDEMQRAKVLLEKLAEYKPLAKIEEMEEQNYNMIDNVLNNGAEKAQREANKKEQEQPAVKVSLKARLAEKKTQIAGSGQEHEVQENTKKNQREI